jgi:hypothetical protein
MDRDSAIKQIRAVRTVVGVAAWVAPRLSGKAFGLNIDDNPQGPYIGRLFGVRDVAFAYGLSTTQGEAQDRWLVAGVGCDLADAAASIAGWRAGYLSTFTGVLVTAAALHGASLGIAALRGGGDSPAAPAPAASS